MTVKRPATKRATLALLFMLPALMGGCPEFRSASIDAVESASNGLLLAALDLFFEGFRDRNTF